MTGEIMRRLLSGSAAFFIYAAILVIFIVAAIKCFVPIAKNAAALRKAARHLIDEGKRGVAVPSWNDLDFLGKGLQDEWARFLQNAQARDAHGGSCDVEDYINVDSAVYDAGNPQLSEMIPGVMVSLGILGTFLGLVTGLSGLTLTDDTTRMLSAIEQLIGGMSTAFLTSIFGVIASLIFNFLNRYNLGRAQRALSHFIDAFQQYGMPKPVDDRTQMIAMQQEQTAYLRAAVEEVSAHMITQMEQSILRALLPVQRSMDNFIVAATREQVEGIDRVATRFVERMDEAMAGRLHQLSDKLDEMAGVNQATQTDMKNAAEAIATMTQDVINMHELSQTVLEQFQTYVSDMAQDKQSVQQSVVRCARMVEDAESSLGKVMETLSQTAAQQARYLAKLQEYQAAVLQNQQQYTAWTDKFLASAQTQSLTTAKELERVSASIKDSAALLNSAYLSFCEQLEEGLSKGLALLDENVTTTTKQLGTTLAGIRQTTDSLPNLLSSSARKYGAQVEQFVSALQQLQRAMERTAQAAEDASREQTKREVS